MRGNYTKTIVLAFVCLGLMALAPKAAAQTDILNVTNQVWSYLQDGSDQGTAWKETVFDDSAWPTGMGLFGWETSGVNYGVPGAFNGGGGGSQFNTEWTSQANGGATTIYARSTFNWAGATANLVLSGTLYLDDGIIIYINGQELHRENMPTGAVTFQTQAPTANPAGEPAFYTFSVAAAGSVITGNNVIAVEVHQAGTGSSDAVFGIDMTGDFAVPPSFTTQPVGATVEQGREYTMTVEADGLPAPTFQWFLNGSPLVGETGASYTIGFMDVTNAGMYHVEASNSASTVPSATVEVVYEEDTTGPLLIAAYLAADGTVVAIFNEPMNPLQLDAFGTAIYETGNPGNELGVASGVLVNGTDWVITTASPTVQGTSYTIEFFDGAVEDQFGTAAGQDLLAVLSSQFVMAAFTDNWKYLQDGSDLTGVYNQSGFDDGLWPEGPGIHGEENNLDPGVNPALPSIGTDLQSTSEGGPVTIYLRRHVLVDKANLISVTANMIFDDGCVVYLNGTEVFRQGVATGQNAATTATSHEADHIDSEEISLDAFIDGDNVIAVEIHATGAGSSDSVWGMELVAVGNPPTCAAPVFSTQPSPVSQTVAEGSTVTYTAEAASDVGCSVSYQWQKDGANIENETSQTLTLNGVTPAANGVYTVIATTVGNVSATSSGATLTVTADTVAPTLVRAVAPLDLGEIRVEMSEAISDTTGGNVANYTVAGRGGGAALTVDSATVNGNIVTLDVTGRLANQNYEITVGGLQDLAAAPNTMVTVTVNVYTEVIVLDTGATDLWRYDDTGTDNGTAWQAALYDDSGWSTGAPMFFGKRGTLPLSDVPIRTEITLSNALGTLQIPTTYYRKSFDYPYDPAVSPPALRYIADDGAVFYFNGSEAHRFGMDPDDLPVFDDTATRTGGTDQPFEDSVSVSGASVVQGSNLIAVEVHQVNLTSSDMGVAVQVLAQLETVDAPPHIASVTIDIAGDLLIEVVGSGDIYVQESPTLTPPTWTTVSGALASGAIYNAGQATGMRYFRLTDTP